MAFGIETSEKLGQGIYLFVPRVQSKIHASSPIHLSTSSPGERAADLMSLCGPGHSWCIPCSTLDQTKSAATGWGGASQEEVVCLGPPEVEEPPPPGCWPSSLLSSVGPHRAHSEESELTPGYWLAPHSSSAASLDTVDLLEE